MITVGADPGEFKFKNSHREKRTHQNTITNGNQQIKKRKKDTSRKEGMGKLGTIFEENEEPKLYPAPNYRGSGVKFHSTVFLRLGREGDRHDYSSPWESKPEKNKNKLLGIMYQHPEKDRRSPQDCPPDKENTVTEYQEILYHIPLPQPQDRPPDYKMEAERKKSQQYKKNKWKMDDWGRESILLCLRYTDHPPYDPLKRYSTGKREKRETLYLLRHVQSPPLFGKAQPTAGTST